ncbi:MFS transporter [Labedaea rhizosphaerae]|uniref:Na+/melibiose symporter-like transporter n=1 Tax=Labedaea rhizosphaerae TaxID=598644 RepID=A0A4R6RSN3_LABRH|nr:MFS transporter [Labedaea rhizosphaerae]TDP89883.1 Na+/melibiose symporter-like transporter [Labedaea rhizosphaerae]
MTSVLRDRVVRLYLIGQSLSSLGDSALWLALAIWVKTLTGSSASAGLVMFFFSAAALAGPVLGAVVDRVRRARLLVIANVLGAAVVLPLLFVHDASQVWLVYVAMFAYGLVNKLIGSAQSALIADLLPADRLAEVNGLLRSTREALRIAAPLMGAGLFVWLGAPAVIALDALTFLTAVVFLLRMGVREERPTPSGHSFGAEIAQGARFVLGHRMLRWLVLGFGVAAFAYGYTESGIFSAVGDGLHLGPAFVGITGTVQGAAAVLVGPFAGKLNQRLGELRLVRLGLGGYAVSLLLLTVPSLPVVLAAMAVAGVSLPLAGVGLLTCVQVSTPKRLQGRVFSATDLVVSVPLAMSVAIGTGLLTLVGYQVLFVIGALVLVVGAAMTLATGANRSTPAEPVHEEPVPV